MTERPAAIAALITDLEGAIARLEGATSRKQRTTRLEVVIAKGVALRDRVAAVAAWLMDHFDETADDEAYLANDAKYRAGWNALDAADAYLQEYKRLHWEELDATDRRGIRTGNNHDAGREAPPQRGLSTAPKTGRVHLLRHDPSRQERLILPGSEDGHVPPQRGSFHFRESSGGGAGARDGG
jgi:hypothetical protein